VKLARLRRPKIAYSPSYADYRPKTNAVILLDMGHTLRGEWTQEKQEKKENLKPECGWCAHCRGMNKVILISQKPLWKGDQEVVKRSGRDEPVWVAIHKWMAAMLGISLYSYLYLKLAKVLCLSYYLWCFLFNKIRE
jgi:hypothetical protein